MRFLDAVEAYTEQCLRHDLALQQPSKPHSRKWGGCWRLRSRYGELIAVVGKRVCLVNVNPGLPVLMA